MRMRVAKKVLRVSAWTRATVMHHRHSTYHRALRRYDVVFRLWRHLGFPQFPPKWEATWRGPGGVFR